MIPSLMENFHLTRQNCLSPPAAAPAAGSSPRPAARRGRGGGRWAPQEPAAHPASSAPALLPAWWYLRVLLLQLLELPLCLLLPLLDLLQLILLGLHLLLLPRHLQQGLHLRAHGSPAFVSTAQGMQSCKKLEQCFSAGDIFTPPQGDIWQFLKTVSAVTTGVGDATSI